MFFKVIFKGEIMKKILTLGLLLASSLAFANSNYEVSTNTPQNRENPNISNDGKVVTEYLRKDDYNNHNNAYNNTNSNEQNQNYNRNQEAQTQDSDIYVQNQDGSNVEVQTNSTNNRVQPNISDDGKVVTEYLRKK